MVIFTSKYGIHFSFLYLVILYPYIDCTGANVYYFFVCHNLFFLCTKGLVTVSCIPKVIHSVIKNIMSTKPRELKNEHSSPTKLYGPLNRIH